LHRLNFYPGTGQPNEIGVDYTNINIGWKLKDFKKTIELGDYIYAFERILAPILLEFAPEIILISAGFDAATGDPLGGINVPPEGFAYMTFGLQ
jgi:histone deacetylase 6